jgi:subtilisin family serine protease/PKD repeat protein
MRSFFFLALTALTLAGSASGQDGAARIVPAQDPSGLFDTATGAPKHSDNRLIVKFRTPPRVGRSGPGALRAASPALDRELQRFEVDAIEPLFPPGGNRALRERLGMDRFFVVRTKRPVDIPAAAAAFRGVSDVESAEPDYVMTAADAGTSALVPNDPLFQFQWALQNTGSNGVGLPATSGADIKAVDAWNITTGDPSIVVAILDSGTRLDHPEFAGRLWVNPGEIAGNDVDDDGNGFIDDVNGYNFVSGAPNPSDDHGHGTAVASIVAANANNALSMAGVDWACRIMTAKVINSANFGFFSWWAVGIVYATDAGARVINMSLVGYDTSFALAVAAQYAEENGCFIAAAMGNSNALIGSTPAILPTVMAVGSTDPMDDRCVPEVCGYGSNFGAHIDVVAPGTRVPALWYADLNGVLSFGGTSAATPLVAGAASLLLARDPTLTPEQLRDVIRASADDQVGRPTEDTPGFDIYHGYGRLNAHRALLYTDHASPPVLTVPSEVAAAEGAPIALDVSAVDPDGDPVQELTADLSAIPAGSGATFDVSADHALGTLRWTPGYTDAGVYPVTFTARNITRGSARTEIHVENINDPPTLTLTENLAVSEGVELLVEASASDPDSDPIVELSVEPIPPGATFETTADKQIGRLRWTPGFDQQGLYPVLFRARSTSTSLGLTLETSAEAPIQVLDEDATPVVSVPPRVDGIEGEPLSISVSADDPDGDPLVEIRADGLPAGAEFTAAPDFRSGVLTWAPSYAQSGAYLVTIAAASVHTAPEGFPIVGEGSAPLLIAIADTPDHPPTIVAPGNVTGAEGAPLEVQVQASDPDGEEMLALAASPLPEGATFIAGPTNTSGSLFWTPDFEQAGAYSVTLSAQSAGRADPVSGTDPPMDAFATMAILIANTDRAPRIVAPSTVAVSEGQTTTFTITASDPDGDAVSALGMAEGPIGATFSEDPSHTGGAFQWAPTFADAGSHTVVFSASNVLTGQATTLVVVANVNRPPVPRPGGPYAGIMGSPIQFDGSASADPDGAPLTEYSWDFGDLTQANGPAPAHTYDAGGAYDVALTVSDGELSAVGTTTATVTAIAQARAFQETRDKVIRLMTTKPTACLRVEPIAGSYDNSDVDVSRMTLISIGTGNVDRIVAAPGKTSASDDRDKNGVEDLAVCFAMTDLRRLFENVTGGVRQVPVTVEGPLWSGGLLRASLDVAVTSSGGSIAAAFSPQPMNARGAFSIRLEHAGDLSVRIYDATGRLVRTLLARRSSPAGYMDLAFDGRDTAGRELRSGVYFYRAESSGQSTAGRLVIVR